MGKQYTALQCQLLSHRVIATVEKKKIFVLGNSRSGTTMMGRMLNKHSSIFTFGELHFFGPLWSSQPEEKILSREEAELLAEKLLARQRQGFLIYKLQGKEKNDAKKIVNSIPDGQRTSIKVFRHFLEFETGLNKKQYSCEQTPPNVFYIKEILEHYPDAYIINMVRDARDVVLSQKRKWKRKFLGASKIPLKETVRAYLNYHPYTISKLWNSAVNTARNFENHERVMMVRFEDVISETEKTLSDICNFLSIPFEAEMLKVPRKGSSNSSDNSNELGANKEVLGQWLKGGLKTAEVEICEKVCKSNLMYFKYPISNSKASLFQCIFYKTSFPIKLGLAFLFNIRRMKNIRQTIKKRFGV